MAAPSPHTAQSINLRDQLGLDHGLNSQRYDRCDMPSCPLRVTAVGDLSCRRASVLQLVLQTLCLGPTHPVTDVCGRTTVLRIGQFFPEPWLAPCRPTTTRPARPRWAGAESRSFERCVPTTSCRDRAPASTTLPRAHGPCTARICTSATAMRTRCGEGDLVGGWHAGASPFTPITRWVTNRGSSSASLAHAYTPLGRSQRL